MGVKKKLDNNNNYCFYCGKTLVYAVIERNEYAKTDNSGSPDHYYPKRHPLYDRKRIVASCSQCNLTKCCGEPENYLDALKSVPLPEWGVRGATVKWYKKTGYDPMKWSKKKGDE